jgi:hypothetical protein
MRQRPFLRIRPQVMQLEDRSAPSSLSGLDGSPDDPFNATQEPHPVVPVSSETLPKKPEPATDQVLSAAPAEKPPPVTTPVPLPTTEPVLRTKGPPPALAKNIVKAKGRPALNSINIEPDKAQTGGGFVNFLTARAWVDTHKQEIGSQEVKKIMDGGPAKTPYKPGAKPARAGAPMRRSPPGRSWTR